MNKQVKILFIIFVVFIFFNSLAYDAEAWSLFGWLKEKFAKKNVPIVQAQPIQKIQTVQNPNNIYYNQFPSSYLMTLNDKCIIYDRILNYCGSLKNWNSYSNPNYYINKNGRLINGNSMNPLLKQGDSLAIRRYNGEKLYSCEIVRVKMPDNYNMEYGYHRIIGFTKDGKVVLRGDNNPKTMYEIVDKKDITDILCGKL